MGIQVMLDQSVITPHWRIRGGGEGHVPPPGRQIHRRTRRGGGTPYNFSNGNFWAKKLVIFGHNHLIFGQAMENIFGQEISAPERNWSRTHMDKKGNNLNTIILFYCL